MKKKSIAIILFLSLVMIFICLPKINVVKAIEPSTWNPMNKTIEGENELTLKAATVVAVIRNIGLIVALIALLIIAIRNMVASVEEKSIIKKALPGYLLGVFMVVAITWIPSTIQKFVENIDAPSEGKHAIVTYYSCKNCGFNQFTDTEIEALERGARVRCRGCHQWVDPVLTQ